MKIIVDKHNRQEGVFIPMEEWDNVIDSVKVNSELHKILSHKPMKPVFEMTPAEFADLLHPVSESLVSKALNHGLYTSHSIKTDKGNGQFLHHYDDGKIELVQIDPRTGNEEVLKVYR